MIIEIKNTSKYDIEEIFCITDILVNQECSFVSREIDTSENAKILHKINEKKSQINGKIAILLFFEDSTRTILSFEIALKKLGMQTISINMKNSSFNKGESLVNFFKNISAMNPDLLIAGIRVVQFLI